MSSAQLNIYRRRKRRVAKQEPRTDGRIKFNIVKMEGKKGKRVQRLKNSLSEWIEQDRELQGQKRAGLTELERTERKGERV